MLSFDRSVISLSSFSQRSEDNNVLSRTDPVIQNLVLISLHGHPVTIIESY